MTVFLENFISVKFLEGDHPPIAESGDPVSGLGLWNDEFDVDDGSVLFFPYCRWRVASWLAEFFSCSGQLLRVGQHEAECRQWQCATKGTQDLKDRRLVVVISIELAQFAFYRQHLDPCFRQFLVQLGHCLPVQFLGRFFRGLFHDDVLFVVACETPLHALSSERTEISVGDPVTRICSFSSNRSRFKPHPQSIKTLRVVDPLWDPFSLPDSLR